ncbi:UNVERIFIED_CONTAM: hypothetical protein FKN15_071282 [Acipenser sinensis]
MHGIDAGPCTATVVLLLLDNLQPVYGAQHPPLDPRIHKTFLKEAPKTNALSIKSKKASSFLEFARSTNDAWDIGDDEEEEFLGGPPPNTPPNLNSKVAVATAAQVIHNYSKVREKPEGPQSTERVQANGSVVKSNSAAQLSQPSERWLRSRPMALSQGRDTHPGIKIWAAVSHRHACLMETKFAQFRLVLARYRPLFTSLSGTKQALLTVLLLSLAAEAAIVFLLYIACYCTMSGFVSFYQQPQGPAQPAAPVARPPPNAETRASGQATRWFFISEAAAQTAVSPLAARHPPDREDLGPECLWGSANGRPRENKAGEVQATSSKSEHRLGTLINYAMLVIETFYSNLIPFEIVASCIALFLANVNRSLHEFLCNDCTQQLLQLLLASRETVSGSMAPANFECVN